MIGKDQIEEPEPNPKSIPEKSGWIARLWNWIDLRTGADELLHKSLEEPIPGGARFAYVFGSALLFIFVSQVITGLCLAVYYVPSPLTAHVTLSYIIKDVAGGSFLRSLHSYGSSAMIVVLVLHFLQTFLYGSYKGRRELLWISGCVLSLLVLGMTFTGYLLRWDLKAYFSGAVGTNLTGNVPLIGGWLLRLIRGGSMLGGLTLSRFYVLHVFIVPAIIFLFIAGHVFMFRKAGAAGPIAEDPVHPHLPAETFYPKQVIIDMAFVLVVMGVLGMLAHFVPEELGPVADPSNSNYLPRPEWYYLPFFEWLKFWEGSKTVIGVVVIPGILIGLVFLLPFLDRSLERRPWKRPIPVGSVLIVLIALIGLGMQSRLDDSRDPTTASEIAKQNLEEDNYFHAPFQPFSASSVVGGAAPAKLSGPAAQGKSIFDSNGCSGCHGEGGVGSGAGPALTHVSDKFQPAQLTAVLKEPNAKMKTGGMVPLTLKDAEMTALVSYLTSLGGASASPATAPTAGSPTAATAEAKAGPPSAPRAPTETAATSAPVGAENPKNMPGKKIYQADGCTGCHGEGGKGTQRGPALVDVGKKLSAAQLAALLRNPTTKMNTGGMLAVTGSEEAVASLVEYLRGFKSSGTAQGQTANAKAAEQPSQTQQATTPASKPDQTSPQPQTVTSASEGTAPAKLSGPAAQGKTIFDSNGCSGCHGEGGVGSGAGPALTHISDKFQPAQLTAVLKEPNAKMKTGGMVPLTLKDAEMTALVSYLRSLGGVAAVSASAPASAPEPVQRPPERQTGPANSAASGQPANPSDQRGEAIYNAKGCASCHGPGGSGTGRAPALTKFSKSITPEALTSLLQNPNPKMQSGGMSPLKLDTAEMSALVAYLKNPGSAAASTGVAPGQYAENKDDVRVHTAAYPAVIQKGYRIFAVKCKQCHGLDESLKAGASSEQAVAEVTRMQAMASSQISDEQAKAIVEFLNYNREHRKPQN